MPALSARKLYHIRNSSIHNHGLFAAADIRKGQRIVEYLGEKISKAESDRRGTELYEKNRHSGDGTVYLFVLNSRWDIDGNLEWNDARLINHSCDPNCEARIINGRIWILATQNIREGGEILFNYGFDLENVWDHPCRCGSPRCVGYIAGEEFWPKLRKMIAERDRAIEEAKKEDAGRKGQDLPGAGRKAVKKDAGSAAKRKSAPAEGRKKQAS